MARGRSRSRIDISWQRNEDNVGVITTHPKSILKEHIRKKGLQNILVFFWGLDLREINMLDVCTMFMYWWKEKDISSAYCSWIRHPNYHSSEYIFDKGDDRLILVLRQPDINGEHWVGGSHVHIVRGKIDPDNQYRVVKPNFDAHIKLTVPQIKGKYICKVKESKS